MAMVFTTYVAPELREGNDLLAFTALVNDFIHEGLIILPAVVLSSPNDLFPLYCGYDDGDPPDFSDVEIAYRGDDVQEVIASISDRHLANRCVCVWFRCLNPQHPKLREQLRLGVQLTRTVECTVGLHLPRRPVNLPITDVHSDHRHRPLREVQQYFEVNGKFAPYSHDIKNTEVVRILQRRWFGRLRFGTSVD